MIRLLYLLFVLSGAAGLIYEATWTRYLGLFVGHDAYAQIIVLVIFLGGMSAGAAVVSRYSRQLKQPLYGYVAVEAAVGCIGLIFHDVFVGATQWAYSSIYPSLAGGWGLTVAKWSIASALILPQSVLLGATFPLMSAGALRLATRRPGRTLAMLYFANSLGAAAGVLVAGFWLVALAGLPGALLAAAMLNLGVAVGTLYVIQRSRKLAPAPAAASASGPPIAEPGAPSPLERVLLFASFGTAVASFVYEIDWIRMLALVLGSATHSFELMLSAFITGLALGAWCVRVRADRLKDPIRTLGVVQWTMGFLALATLPLYAKSFNWTAALLFAFARTDGGYVGFTLARYAICLAVMLPATFCAGMTLPLITRILYTSGSGERAIGAVYAWNTLGSIVGVIVGGLVLMPALGLKGMLVAGAAIDMGIGVLLLTRAKARAERRWLVPATAVAMLAVLTVIVHGTRLDPTLLASGVFRSGILERPGERTTRYYRDGRTATVSVLQSVRDGQLSLATNGKPDASLSPDWFRPCDSTSRRKPLVSDAATQTLLPLVTLAYAPSARYAAVIGQGSGMSSHFLLASPALKDLVTIEIEPQMVEGSRVFYPVNRRAFDDPRSHRAIEDAKSYFASSHRRYDLIMSEPSNPWVSGVSGLFTTEFYARVRQYLADGGVFGQWLHVYELDDGLVLSVLAAIHQNFPAYQVYLVPHGDLLVVASNGPLRQNPDWSVAQLPALRQDLCRFLPLTPATFEGLRLADRHDLAPLLDEYTEPNSDFYPVLDLGAERRRFRRDHARGFPALSGEWFNLLSSISRRRAEPGGDQLPAFPQNPRLAARATSSYLRTPSPEASADVAFGSDLRQAEYSWQSWLAAMAADRPPVSWDLWVTQAGVVQRLRNGGTAGVADEELHKSMLRYIDRHQGPDVARDVIIFRHAIDTWNFAEASAAADRLLPVIRSQPRWIAPDEFRDGAVMAKLQTGQAKIARRMLDYLEPTSNRSPGDLRSRLLESYVEIAEKQQSMAGK
jgi:predicted membrane-bound spermidine synthase